jgi:hypothetical protein
MNSSCLGSCHLDISVALFGSLSSSHPIMLAGCVYYKAECEVNSGSKGMQSSEDEACFPTVLSWQESLTLTQCSG